ncbi:FecR family protein [Pseudidiomarina sp.]|uniref:FecR family protein n=1 Tax=Pseudidiomarina sp. TaxID=2081707 RepID=UPI00299EDFE3|nr:FecR family protein [Pseudidiomarina sp.]MDX1705261.1 FecR family protein [Pseudidiomarina sp.]
MFTNQMRHACRITLLTIGLALISGVAQANELAARVLFVFGEVTIDRNDETLTAARNTQVLVGDRIITTEGASVQLRFTDDSLIALRPSSEFVVRKHVYDPEDPASGEQSSELIRGGFRAITGAMATAVPASVEFKTPVATMGIRGTEFRLVHVPPGSESQFNSVPSGSYLLVATGRMIMFNRAGQQLVNAGQSFFVADADTPPQTLPVDPDKVFADDGTTEEGSTEDDEPAPATPVTPANTDSGTSPPQSQPVTIPEQAQQDAGQQQAVKEAEKHTPEPEPEPDPVLPGYGLNSSAHGYLQRSSAANATFNDAGELTALTTEAFSFTANDGAGPGFAQQLDADGWHPGSANQIYQGFWQADDFTLTLNGFTAPDADSFHYLLANYSVADIAELNQLTEQYYQQQTLLLNLQPNYGVRFDDGSIAELSSDSTLTIDFTTGTLTLDLPFTYGDDTTRALQGSASFADIFAGAMTLSELGANPIVSEALLYGSFSGDADWGIDGFLAGLYLLLNNDGDELAGWGTLLFSNNCWFNFPCQILATDYRSMQQLNWNNGGSMSSLPELTIAAGAPDTWLQSTTEGVTGALLAQQADTAAGSYRFLGLDPEGLIGGDADHRLSVETVNGPLEIYWGYWQPGSYQLRLLEETETGYSFSDLNNDANYHFVAASDLAPATLPDNGVFNFSLAGGTGLIGDDSQTQATSTGGQIIVDFTNAKVLVMLLFDVEGQSGNLSAFSDITALLNQSESGLELVGEGYFSSGRLLGQFVGGDFDALLGLLTAASETEQFRGSLVFTQDPVLGTAIAELGVQNGGMLGMNQALAILSDAENTRVLSSLFDIQEFVPVGQTGAAGSMELSALFNLDEDDFWFGDIEVPTATDPIAIRFGAFAPGTYELSDSNGGAADTSSPYYFALTDSLTPATTTLPTGAWTYDLFAGSPLESQSSTNVFGFSGQVLVNFDTGGVGIALQLGSYTENEAEPLLGSLFGSTSVAELFSAEVISLLGAGYFEGGGGSLSARFAGQDFDAIIAILSAYTAGETEFYQGAGVFASAAELHALPDLGEQWATAGLLGGNGELFWQAEASEVFGSLYTDEFTGESNLLIRQVNGGDYVSTLADTSQSYYSYRVSLPGSEPGSEVWVQWNLWEPHGYYLQERDDQGNLILRDNSQPVIQLLASELTPMTVTPLQNQLYFSLYLSDGFYFNGNDSETTDTWYLDDAALLVDFADDSVTVSVSFSQWIDNVLNEGYLKGEASVANLFTGSAIELTGYDGFAGGGGRLSGLFMGPEYQGIMALLKAWTAEQQQELFGMMVLNQRPVQSLADLGWTTAGGVLSVNNELVISSLPANVLLAGDNYGGNYGGNESIADGGSFYYASLLRITTDDFSVNSTRSYSGFFDPLPLPGASQDVQVRWGYWDQQAYSFDQPGYSNDSTFWHIGADQLTPLTAPLPAGTINFDLYLAAMSPDEKSYAGYTYMDSAGLAVDFDSGSFDLNMSFLRYLDTGSGQPEFGDLNGSGLVADLFENNTISLSGTGLFNAGGGEFTGRFIGSDFDGVMGLFRGWTGNDSLYSGAVVFSRADIAAATTEADWGYWQVDELHMSGYQQLSQQSLQRPEPLPPEILLQRSLLNGDLGQHQALQRSLQRLAEDAATLHPGQPRIILDP